MVKTVGMVLGNTFPPDVRVEKEAIALTQAGFKMHLLCLCEEGKKKEDNYKQLEIHRWLQIQSGLTRKLKILRDQFTFVFHDWKKDISEFIQTYNIDAVHVHDLPLVKTVIESCNGSSVKIVADFHENYPAGLQQWKEWTKGWRKIVWKYLGNYERWIYHESEMCNQVDHIIAVVDEMKERLIKSYGLSEKKITVIGNTEQSSFIKEAKIYDDIVQKYDSHFTLLYIGGFGPHRGLDVAIQGLKYIREEETDVKLLIVGKGSPFVVNRLKKIISDNDLYDFVEMRGWQPFETVYSYMKACKVGLIPHNFGEHTNNTIPHKLFQFMMTGTPVLVSSCKPLSRVVNDLESGLIFRAGDSKDFADKILMLYRNKKQYSYFSRNAENHTLYGKWNWKYTGQQLVDFYSNL